MDLGINKIKKLIIQFFKKLKSINAILHLLQISAIIVLFLDSENFVRERRFYWLKDEIKNHNHSFNFAKYDHDHDQ